MPARSLFSWSEEPRIHRWASNACPAFEAGAHIDLHLGDGLIRQYLIASSPQEQDHYLLCVRRQLASHGGSDQYT